MGSILASFARGNKKPPTILFGDSEAIISGAGNRTRTCTAVQGAEARLLPIRVRALREGAYFLRDKPPNRSHSCRRGENHLPGAGSSAPASGKTALAALRRLFRGEAHFHQKKERLSLLGGINKNRQAADRSMPASPASITFRKRLLSGYQFIPMVSRSRRISRRRGSIWRSIARPISKTSWSAIPPRGIRPSARPIIDDFFGDAFRLYSGTWDCDSILHRRSLPSLAMTLAFPKSSSKTGKGKRRKAAPPFIRYRVY